MLKSLLSLGFAASFLVAAAPPEKPAMPVTELHRAIASQQVWLNTSRSLTAEDLRGRIILLDFWTYCCINCMHVIPDLQYLEEKFGDKLTVIGVHSAKFANERDTENIRSAILRYGIHHPVVNDFDFSVWRRFGVRAWPTFILINPSGMMEQVYSGEGNREDVERDVAQLVKKYGDQLTTAPLPLALEKEKAPETPLSFPGKIVHAADLPGGEALIVSDSGHHRLAVLNMDGTLRDTIGSGEEGLADGDFAAARFNAPQGMAYRAGVLYVADTENHALRKVDFAAKTVVTVAGTGKQGYERTARTSPAKSTPLASPWDVAFYPDENHLAIAMAGTHQLWSYDIAAGTVSVLAGNGRESIDDGLYPANSLSQPSGLAVMGGALYFVDSETSSLRVMEEGRIRTLIGTGLFDFGFADGPRGLGLMQHPLGIAAANGKVYVADSYNHSLRVYDVAGDYLSTFAGGGARGNADGTLADARFNEPGGLALVGSSLFVTDTNNHLLRKVDFASGMVSTLESGKPPPPVLRAPENPTTLPNLLMLRTHALPPDESKISLDLMPGWHINEEAPSALTLFDLSAPGTPRVLAEYNRETLRTGPLAVPVLAEGGKYLLQGTLYYCRTKAGSQCLISGVDIKLSVDKKGAPLRIPLR